MRKPLMAVAIVACLIMTVVGGLVPILQGWIFFVIALYLLATEFERGRRWVKAARRRWPWPDRWIERARDHRWAPSYLKEFEVLTDPKRGVLGCSDSAHLAFQVLTQLAFYGRLAVVADLKVGRGDVTQAHFPVLTPVLPGNCAEPYLAALRPALAGMDGADLTPSRPRNGKQAI